MLELAVAEMAFGGEEDLDSVIINEAVELAKKFGGEEDYQFVNGVLGTIARGRAGEPEPEAEEPAAAAEAAPAAESDPEK